MYGLFTLFTHTVSLDELILLMVCEGCKINASLFIVVYHDDVTLTLYHSSNQRPSSTFQNQQQLVLQM